MKLPFNNPLQRLFCPSSIAALFTCLWVPATAVAHHGGAAYDMTQQVTVEGKVASLSWANPHISITVEIKGPDGVPRLQEIEAMSVSQARGLGLRREAISSGASIVVRAFPNRRGSGQRLFGFTVTTSDGAVMPLSSSARFSAAPPGSWHTD